MAMKIKVGDTVRVIAGKDKDKEGKVLAVDGSKVKVEGINTVSRHTKPSASNPQGGIVTQEAFIDVSNVMYLAKGEAVRVGLKVDADGTKSRINKKTGEVIDVVKKPKNN
jgi:large subunit ribosomal protein L24